MSSDFCSLLNAKRCPPNPSILTLPTTTKWNQEDYGNVDWCLFIATLVIMKGAFKITKIPPNQPAKCYTFIGEAICHWERTSTFQSQLDNEERLIIRLLGHLPRWFFSDFKLYDLPRANFEEDLYHRSWILESWHMQGHWVAIWSPHFHNQFAEFTPLNYSQ